MRQRDVFALFKNYLAAAIQPSMKSGDVLVAYSRRFVNETCRRAKALEFLTYIRIFFEIIHE